MALDGSGAPLAGAMSGGAARAAVHAAGWAGREQAMVILFGARFTAAGAPILLPQGMLAADPLQIP